MHIEILAHTDDAFSFVSNSPKIECKQFGEVWVACDGKRSVIGITEEAAINGLIEAIKTWQLPTPVQEELEEIEVQVVEEIPQPPDIQRGARIENHTETNSFDFFSGTSLAGRKNSFD